MVLICQTARPDSDHSPSNPLETILRSSLRLGSAMENTTANTNTQKHPETRQLQQQHGCKVSQRRGLQMSFDAGKPGRISINIYIYIMLSDPCLYETESGWTAWIATAMVPPTTAAPAVPSPHKICNCQTFISIGNGRWGRGDSGQYCYQSIEVLGVPSCAQEFSFLLSLPTFLCICCKHLLTRSGWRQ